IIVFCSFVFSSRRRHTRFKCDWSSDVCSSDLRTGYSAIADEWIGIRPGTDGLFVLSLVHELLCADKIDFDYLGRYTNAGWLVIRSEERRVGKECRGRWGDVTLTKTSDSAG